MEMNEELYFAILAKDVEKIKLFLKNGCSGEDINAYGSVGDNIAKDLLRQSQIGISLFDTLDVLIDNGLNINYRDENGDTLLILYLTELVTWNT